MAKRGATVSYETIRDWVGRFRHHFAARIRRDRPAPTDKWQLDEIVVRIKDRTHWLWRAVDANGGVLDILAQTRWDKAAALRFLRKLLKRRGRPRVMVTDKLRSYGAAQAAIAPGLEHRQHKGLNNSSEASHRHTPRREKIMGRFGSPCQTQRFLSVHNRTASIFRPNIGGHTKIWTRACATMPRYADRGSIHVVDGGEGFGIDGLYFNTDTRILYLAQSTN